MMNAMPKLVGDGRYPVHLHRRPSPPARSARRIATVAAAENAASVFASAGNPPSALHRGREHLRDRAPRDRRGRRELFASERVRVPEQRVRGHGAEYSRGYARELRDELFSRRQSHHHTGFEIVHEVARLTRAAARHRRRHEIGHDVPGRDEREYELDDLSHRTDGVDVRLAGAPHGDVAHRRGDGNREERLPERHAERPRQRPRRRDRGGGEAHDPPTLRNRVGVVVHEEKRGGPDVYGAG